MAQYATRNTRPIAYDLPELVILPGEFRETASVRSRGGSAPFIGISLDWRDLANTSPTWGRRAQYATLPDPRSIDQRGRKKRGEKKVPSGSEIYSLKSYGILRAIILEPPYRCGQPDFFRQT